MQSKYENVEYFLAVSALYFRLTDRLCVDSQEDDLLEFFEAINEHTSLLSPEQHVT